MIVNAIYKKDSISPICVAKEVINQGDVFYIDESGNLCVMDTIKSQK